MTDPIASRSTDRTPLASYDPGPESQTQLTTRSAPPPPPPPTPEPPDTPATNAMVCKAVNAALASRAYDKQSVVTTRVDATVEVAQQTPIQQRLDAFKESATPTFRLPGGQEVKVAIPFRMTVGRDVMRRTDAESRPFIAQERIARSNDGELDQIAGRVGLSPAELGDLKAGRGTPEQIRRVAQALIEAGRLPSGSDATAGARVRLMMCDYGVGLDCAGYAQQAFLAAHGISRTEAHLKVARNEDLSGLSLRGYQRVAPKDLKPGDLFILGRPDATSVGHAVIVRTARAATAEEVDGLARRETAWAGRSPATIRRVEVDSSWGSHADPQRGGVQRKIWWRDDARNEWLSQSESQGPWRVGNTPYPGHPIDGAYRPGTGASR